MPEPYRDDPPTFAALCAQGQQAVTLLPAELHTAALTVLLEITGSLVESLVLPTTTPAADALATFHQHGTGTAQRVAAAILWLRLAAVAHSHGSPTMAARHLDQAAGMFAQAGAAAI